MKVIVDARTTQDEIKFNGVGRYSRLIIEHLVRNNPRDTFDLIMYDNPSTIDGLLHENPENVNVIRIGEYSENGFINMIIDNLDIVFHFRLNKALSKINTKRAVFFSPYFWKGLPVFHLPTVVTVHDFALPVFNIYSTISPLHNFIRKIHYWIELYRVYFAKEVLVDAKFTVSELLRYLPKLKRKNITEVLLGVYEDVGESDFEQYLPYDYKKRGYILYLGGGITENKNSKGVIDGYKDFINRLKDKDYKKDEIPYLVIAGKNFTSEHVSNSDKLKKYIEKLELKEFVHFTGKYDDIARWGLLRNSLAFIHLSLYEGFGFAVAEAMRAKIPVIAHNGSTYPEVVGDGGILVDGKNSKEVGNAIYKVFSNKKFAASIANKGYKKSLEYDWNTTAQETIDKIREVYKKYVE